MRYQKTLPYPQADLERLVGSYIRARVSGQTRGVHPIVQDVLDHDATLLDLAAAINGARGLEGVELNRAGTSGAFAEALPNYGMTSLVHTAYESTSDDVALCVRDVLAPNFKPVAFSTADVDEPVEIPDGGGPVAFPETDADAGVTGALTTYGMNLFITRATIVNDDVGLINAMAAAAGAHLARLELRLLSAAVEANATLGDGSAQIGTANTASTGALSVSTLDSACEKLRLLPSATGALMNLRPATLLVPAGVEVSAATILQAAGLEGRIRVVCSPWLTADHSYLFADTSIYPAFVRLRRRGQPMPSVVSRQVPPEQDGLAMQCRHDVAIVAVGRGIVKIPAS